MNYLPNKLLKLRKHYNYSQSYVAEILGIDVVDYMAYENGRAVLNFAQCRKIANLYHVSTIDIFRNSDEVTLYEVSKAKTDELNIEYFLPKKTLKDHIEIFMKKHGVLVGVTLGVVIVGIIALNMFSKKPEVEDVPYKATLQDINRLSLSNTTVVYISNESAVKGTGDNSNGQLSNLPSNNAIKVAEGKDFTIILNNDGSIISTGLEKDLADKLANWKNIVDIAAGDRHVVGVDTSGKVYAIGDNSYGQCEVEEFKNISKVFASSKSTIVIDKNGNPDYVGEFVGSSLITKYNSIIDVDTSNDNSVILTDDNQVEYFTKKSNFLNIYKWRNVIQVTCGDNFIAALTKDGNVLIDCDNQSMIDETSKWKNIIAIDAGDEYLVGFDGEKLYGAGKNDYHQFEKEEVKIEQLPQVGGVKIFADDTVDVYFDRVDNATGYEVKLLLDDPQVYKVSSNQTVSFVNDNLEDGITYQIVITTLGDGKNYIDSEPLVAPFTYYKKVKENIDYVDIDKDFETMSVEEFTNYMKEIGVQDTNLIRVKTGKACEGNQEMIISVDGLSKGQRILRSDLANAHITYNYCTIDETTIENEETQDEQTMEN